MTNKVDINFFYAVQVCSKSQGVPVGVIGFPMVTGVSGDPIWLQRCHGTPWTATRGPPLDLGHPLCPPLMDITSAMNIRGALSLKMQIGAVASFYRLSTLKTIDSDVLLSPLFIPCYSTLSLHLMKEKNF